MKRLRHRSKKMEALYRIRRPVVKAYMEEHPVCERCLMARSTDPHEPLTRARGGSIVDPENIVALCRKCHSEVHASPAQSLKEGWLKRREDNKA